MIAPARSEGTHVDSTESVGERNRSCKRAPTFRCLCELWVQRHIRIALKSPWIKLEFRFPFFRPLIRLLCSARSIGALASNENKISMCVRSPFFCIDAIQQFSFGLYQTRAKFFLRWLVVTPITFQSKLLSYGGGGKASYSIHRDLILLCTTQFLLPLFVSGCRIQRKNTTTAIATKTVKHFPLRAVERKTK